MKISESLSRIAQNLMPDNNWTQDDYEHLKNITTALEEKQERENGCEYCDFSSGDVAATINNVGDNFVMIKSEDGISISTDDAAFRMLHIKFCPMCGRELGRQPWAAEINRRL